MIHELQNGTGKDHYRLRLFIHVNVCFYDWWVHKSA
ncbi:hypothetical protein PHAMO_210183 [Magnetospirillum molischianum DSM 120]|uniref:Uncharacterized protein n=1 Tax=Magnetospirillum molischianum DSM 120 TaxID=1150626 RepID=H8FQN4_MAGML|nr:hypothetical protein PHAMO_210183 [Magnetospirillum molischianum DSM 120]